ncbi:histidine phosphatase family protein [Clostridium ganghwense]|uniref:Phosphoglycerate mutase family protein n=1 Tax=Clostridium ganghwense TaxID=312089 RepID=A0ABT4CRZ6_9CLOT|nr:histidine phosphatase family protein [Clostridium ganghwense]MCY6371188.1 phosphoglycerate mutase family protein [Clostridium ganghwense]
MKKRLLAFCLIGMMSLVGIGCGQQKKEVAKEKKPVTLYVTRHGKTMLNTSDRVQGWADAPLTKPGVEVAEFLGKGITDVPFAAAYSSDSGRAIETAKIVLDKSNQKNIKLAQTKNIREACFGKYEGELNHTMWEEVAKANNITLEQFMKKLDFKMFIDTVAKLDETKQAETWKQLTNRVRGEVDKIADEAYKNGGGNVLVVSHGIAISALVESIAPGTVKGPLANASVTKIVYDNGKYTIESVNDMSYVEKGKSVK